MVISSIIGIAIFEVFTQSEFNFLHNQATGNIVNSNRHALHVVSSYLSNAGYGISNISSCQNINANINGTVSTISAIVVSPSGTPKNSSPSPVSLTIMMSSSNYAGIPVGQMVSNPSPSATSFDVNSVSTNGTTSQTAIQNNDTLMASFPEGQCAMVVATGDPSCSNGACSVSYSTGLNGENGTATFSSLLPNLTSTDMNGAQVYDIGSNLLSTTTFSVTPGTASQPGEMQISTNGSTPELFAQNIDDMQILFGYNTSGGQAVTSYGYYDPQYARDIRTANVVLIARSKIRTAGTVTPSKVMLFPQIPANESVTGSTLPALYYVPPTGVTNQQFNIMQTTVPVMNQIW